MVQEMIESSDAPGTLVERAARYWASVRYEDLPPEIIETGKLFLLDTLAAGIAGANTQVVDTVLNAMRASIEGASGSSIVWGRSVSLPAAQAALVNGTAAHALELDDFGGCGHSGAVVVPVVSALAERERASGREALTALIAGYDLAARVLEGAGGYRPHNEAGWHSTGTCGSFGAAAAAAKLLHLDPERFADALGIAGTFTGGIWAYLVDGAMTKRFHPGKAAENGLSAALLAQAGMSGPRHVLEAEWGGFFGTYSAGKATPEATLAGLGREFRIESSGMKPYACCRGIHACIDAVFEIMREAGARSGEIAHMRAHGNAQTERQFNRQHIVTLLDAQFSIPYCLAVAAESGGAGLNQFVPLRLDDPEIRRLMAVTDVVADRVLGPTDYAAVEISLSDGRSFERQIRFAKGAPENPLTPDEVHAKAVSLLEPVLGRPACNQLVTTILGLDKVADFRDLARLFRAGPVREVA